jgi:hypothetical protein
MNYPLGYCDVCDKECLEEDLFIIQPNSKSKHSRYKGKMYD